MIPIKFKEANVTYGEGQPEYIPLPALRCPNDPEGKVFTKWKLSPEELEKVNETGEIVVSLMTFNQPLQPISVMTEIPEL